MAQFLDVKPDLLRWAIERSGVPIEQYREPVQEWLSGQRRPTLHQLEAFARRAMVPFGYLVLQSPPEEKLPVPDFRTRQGEAVRRPSPNLIETIFAMQRRQDWMREYLVDAGHGDLPFVGSATLGERIDSLARTMRTILGLEDDWAERRTSWEESLRFLREQIENAGILIFINGIVGNSTRRRLDPEEFQGFVLVDRVAPLIFVNGADFKVAQMFTIAHELAHVWVGQSALFDLVATGSANVAVEKYCNSVAAEFLVPVTTLREAWPKGRSDDAALAALARRFKVSPIVIGRCAKDAKLISAEAFFKFYQWYVSREYERRDETTSGGNFWLTQNVRLGHRFGRAVVAAAEEGQLSYSDAYDLTQLYGETFDKYASRLRQEDQHE